MQILPAKEPIYFGKLHCDVPYSKRPSMAIFICKKTLKVKGDKVFSFLTALLTFW